MWTRTHIVKTFVLLMLRHWFLLNHFELWRCVFVCLFFNYHPVNIIMKSTDLLKRPFLAGYGPHQPIHRRRLLPGGAEHGLVAGESHTFLHLCRNHGIFINVLTRSHMADTREGGERFGLFFFYWTDLIGIINVYAACCNGVTLWNISFYDL